MLIAAILGVESRTTMDMDATIKGFEFKKEKILKILEEISNIEVEDDVIFDIKKIEDIREDDDYGGYRIYLISIFDNMQVPLKIDITTGDKITHREIKYKFNLMLEDRKIEIWSYNVETIIAEKFECIIKRGILNTRTRDFYDIYMLIKTQKKNIDDKLLKLAIINTCKHRNTEVYIINWKDTFDMLINDLGIKIQWEKYRKNNFYASNIEYIDVINTIFEIWILLDN